MLSSTFHTGPAAPDLEEVRRELRQRRSDGEPAKRAVAEVAQRYGLPHREVYRMWLEAVADPAD